MKQKKQLKIAQLSKFIFLATFLLVEFFGFGSFKIASSASCSYSYKYHVSFDVNPKTVPADGNVTFSTIVTASDSSGLGPTACPVNKPVIIHYYYYPPVNGTQDASQDITLNLVNGQAQDTNTTFALSSVPTNLQSTSSGSVTYPQSYRFQASVYGAQQTTTTGGQTVVQKNSSFGADTASGLVTVSVTAPGSGTSNQTSGGTNLPTGATCVDSSNCQSNYCVAAGTTVTCQPCGSPSDCNSNGDSGYACTNGVCVPGSTTSNQPGATTPNQPVSTTPNQPAATTYNCNTPNAQNCLYNPLPEDNLTSTLLLIGKGFLGVIAIWAAVFIIIGGFQLVMSSGNEEMVLKAKKTIMWAVLGLVVALLSFSIIAIVQNLFQANIQPVTTTTTTPATPTTP